MANETSQVGALPWRISPDGAVEVMLITSRETRRWVIPKGYQMRGKAPHAAAAQEAWEEAGLTGAIANAPLGSYRYLKRFANGGRELEVAVFALAVDRQASDWPERTQRDTRWFTRGDAAAAVTEVQLKAIISAFSPLPKRRFGAPASTGRLSMVSWFQALMPKQGRFFEQFEEHAAVLSHGAEALAKLLNGAGAAAENIAEVVRREHEADDITRDVLQGVRRVFVTPFDRSAITSLIGVMDDSIDEMNKTVKAIELYEVEKFDTQMCEMGKIIVEAASTTAQAMPLLRDVAKNADKLNEMTAHIIHIEGKADEIHAAGLKVLYKAHGATDPMQFIVGSELFSHLERIVDRFEDVANEIQGLVIDHA